MPVPPKPDPVKHCETCGNFMARKRFNGRLEDRGVFLRRRHCSLSCANTRKDVVKDTLHWRARRQRAEACTDCGTTERLHVHHKDRNPANNTSNNLVTLCASCHLKLHWREDRVQRMAALRGARMNRRSAGGKASSVV